MNQELDAQRAFWDREVIAFDSIYSGSKHRLGVCLDRFFRRDMYGRFAYAMKHAEPIRGRTFLDVGCGTGRYALELARRDAQHVVGIDISPNMIRACTDRARTERLDDRTTFREGDILGYDPDAVFDTCLGIGLFDYIRTPLPVLRAMREHIRETAIVSFPRRWTWRAPVRKLRLTYRGCYVRFYTVGDIDRLLRAAGFSRYDLTTVGKLHCVTAYA